MCFVRKFLPSPYAGRWYFFARKGQGIPLNGQRFDQIRLSSEADYKDLFCLKPRVEESL